jgi:hypothetical protein
VDGQFGSLPAESTKGTHSSRDLHIMDVGCVDDQIRTFGRTTDGWLSKATSRWGSHPGGRSSVQVGTKQRACTREEFRTSPLRVVRKPRGDSARSIRMLPIPARPCASGERRCTRGVSEEGIRRRSGSTRGVMTCVRARVSPAARSSARRRRRHPPAGTRAARRRRRGPSASRGSATCR